MAAWSIGYGVKPISTHLQTQIFTFKHSPHNYSCLISTQFLLPKFQSNTLRLTHQKYHTVLPRISAIQSTLFKVIQTVFKIGKDGVEAGTNLVPEAVPRPMARLSVTVFATAFSLFILRSLLSTVFFTAGVMGFVYFLYLALSKDKGPKLDEKPGSTDEAIDQANKIMDKYK